MTEKRKKIYLVESHQGYYREDEVTTPLIAFENLNEAEEYAKEFDKRHVDLKNNIPPIDELVLDNIEEMCDELFEDYHKRGVKYEDCKKEVEKTVYDWFKNEGSLKDTTWEDFELIIHYIDCVNNCEWLNCTIRTIEYVEKEK